MNGADTVMTTNDRLLHRMAAWAGCHALALLLVVVGLKGLLLAVYVPLWEIPDEPAHVQYVQTLVEDRAIPHGDGSWIRFSPEILGAIRSTDYFSLRMQHIVDLPNARDDGNINNSALQRTTGAPYVNPAGVYGPLYYFVEAAPYAALRQFSIATRVYGMRIVSAGFFVVTVLYVFRLATLFGRRKSFALTVGALVGFHPMASFLFSGVTNDAFFIAVSSVLLYEIARWVVGDAVISTRCVSIVALLIAFAVSSKISAAIFVPLVLGVLWYRRNAMTSRVTFRYVLVLLGIVGVLSGAWIWWSMLLHRSVAVLTPDAVRSAFDAMSMQQYIDALLWYRYPLIFVSYWGAIGQWFCAPRITYPVVVFAVLFALNLLSLIGLLVFRAPKWRNGDSRERRLVRFFGASVVVLELLYLAFFYLTSSTLHIADFPNQGRYYFILIGPIMILTLLGLESFGGRQFRTVVRAVCASLMVFFIAFTMYPLMYRGYHVTMTTNVVPVTSEQASQDPVSSRNPTASLIMRCNPPIR